MKNSIIILLSLLFCVSSCTTKQPKSTIQASITINTDATAKAYNPMIFGGFLEHFGKQIYGGVFDLALHYQITTDFVLMSLTH